MMHADVDLRIEVIDGADAGYKFEDHKVIPMFEPPLDGYIHPYKFEYNFTTPGLHQKMMNYDAKIKDVVGFPSAVLMERKSDAVFLLKRILESSEAVQNVNGAASTLLNGIECNSEFIQNIEAAVKLLEGLS